MAQVIVRDLEDDVKKHLQQRAKRHGRSMEAEIRDILRSAVATPTAPEKRFGTSFARRFEGFGLDEPVSEIRGNIALPADLSE